MLLHTSQQCDNDCMPTNVQESRAESVQRRPYKQLFIEVELYKRRDGGYYAWPYIGREQSPGLVKQHFVLSEERFATKEAALKAAFTEGQAKIDAGFDPDKM